MPSHNESKQSKLIPLIEYEYPDKTVTVQFEGKSAPREINREEYNAEFHVEMKTGIYYKPEIEPLVKLLVKKLSDEKPTQATKDVSQFLTNPINYFKIRHLSKKCGYGLVAKVVIPSKTITGIYSGELLIKLVDPNKVSTEKEREDSVYDMSIIHSIELDGKLYHVYMHSKDYGDHTRLAPHLPEDEHVKNEKFPPSIPPKDIFRADMGFHLAILEGKPIMFYRANRQIEIDEIAGISYGLGYWVRRGKPDYLLREEGGLRIIAHDPGFKMYTRTKDFLTNVSIPSHAKPPVVLPALARVPSGSFVPAKGSAILVPVSRPSFIPASLPVHVQPLARPTVQVSNLPRPGFFKQKPPTVFGISRPVVKTPAVVPVPPSAHKNVSRHPLFNRRPYALPLPPVKVIPIRPYANRGGSSMADVNHMQFVSLLRR